MSFFEQDIIKGELEEMMNLYVEIRESISEPWKQTLETKKECLTKLERLVELQEFLYFRAKYSEDSEAKEFASMLRDSAIFLGIPPGTDLSEIFTNMKQDIASALEKLDNPN
jgi:hypothetical protein